MNMLENPRHPLWKLLRMLVVGGFVLAALWLFYDRLDNRDLMTILTAVFGVLGYDITKDKLANKKPQEEGQSDAG